MPCRCFSKQDAFTECCGWVADLEKGDDIPAKDRHVQQMLAPSSRLLLRVIDAVIAERQYRAAMLIPVRDHTYGQFPISSAA